MFTFRGTTWREIFFQPSGAVAIFLATFVSGCGAASTPKAPSAPAGAEADGEEPGAEDSALGQGATANGEPVPKPEAESVATPSWLEDGREGTSSLSLPRLSFRHLGMHIGGGANDADSKKPWLQDIESATIPILRCYRRVRNPGAGGSYGIDLYVGRGGGSPEIRGSRQKIGDEDFDACMQEAFRSIRFHSPERPTVVSYSLLFQLEGED